MQNFFSILPGVLAAQGRQAGVRMSGNASPALVMHRLKFNSLTASCFRADINIAIHLKSEL
jgi:hypothetical protein